MILRGLSENLKQQNWTAIWIEFVLLVAGVFFGIQVSNWNEDRLEAQRADGYIERIERDLDRDIATMGRRLAFWQQVIDYGQGAIDYSETGQLVDDSAWQTLLAFYQASQLFPYVPIDITYQELRSAGELGLLPSESMREGLADYYVGGNGYAAVTLSRVDPEYRKLVRGYTPTVASQQVWTACHETTGGDDQLMRPCDSPMSEADAQRVLDGYLADPRLLPELRFWITNLRVMRDLVGEHQQSSRALANQLQREK